MILLAEHDEPSLAAKKKQQHVALKTATSTPKNRVWGFENTTHGRPAVEPQISSETATGSVQFSYENASGRAYYYTRDHLGSVREMTDSSDTIQSRYDYDPYGRNTVITGTVPSDFQYAGYYTHATSGLSLTMFRAYDPITARWLSRDPLPNAERIEGPNLYLYCGNDPVLNVDPSGKVFGEGAAVGGLVGGILGLTSAAGYIIGYDAYMAATGGCPLSGKDAGDVLAEDVGGGAGIGAVVGTVADPDPIDALELGLGGTAGVTAFGGGVGVGAIAAGRK